jgi:hypothetical protein
MVEISHKDNVRRVHCKADAKIIAEEKIGPPRGYNTVTKVEAETVV